MRTVTSADGTSIAFERDGDGPPLVLLHGGGTHEYWTPLVPAFADEFTVVRPDRRGRGESGDTEPYSLAREVEDARAVVDAVDGDPVLFGHSFGGRQAIEAARERSVAAVVAYEPAYLVGDYRERADLAARMQERLDAGQIDDFDTFLEAWPAWPACVEHVENTVRMDSAIEDHALPESLDVGAPALLLTGTNGPAHLRESVRAVHDALGRSRLVEFDGVSHLGPLEAPDRVVSTVRSFLAESRDTVPTT